MLILALVTLTGWPEFRGPTGDGHAADANPVHTWSETENIRWKVAVPGVGWSSPVVGAGRVWVTTSTPDGTERSLVALDAETGAIQHNLLLFRVPNPPDIRQYNSYATPTPALSGDRVIAHFGSAGTACVDVNTGAVLWTRTDFECDHHRGAASSPVVWDDKVFLQFDGFDKQYVVALRLSTGETVWEKPRELPYPENGDLKKAFATPAVLSAAGEPELVASAAVGTIAYDLATGAERWRVIHGGMNEACRPFTRHGLIYLTTGHTQQLWAIRPGPGDLTETGVAWKFTKEAATRSSPVPVGDDLYTVNDKGVLTCLNARTGAVRWQERLGDTVSASPIFAGGKVFVCGEKGATFVITPDPDSLVLVATNRLEAGCLASPAAVGAMLYLRTKTHLYCVGSKK